MRSKTLFLLTVLCLILGFSSCVTSKDTNLLQDIPMNYPSVQHSEYKVIPGDQLTITVYALDKETRNLFRRYNTYYAWEDQQWENGTQYQVERIRSRDLSYRSRPFTVYSDGTINFPFLGTIYVSGFSILEIRKIVSEKLNEFSEGASANVSLYNRYFSVLGATGAQRVAMPSNDLTIFQALTLANQIGATGDRRKVSIIRQTLDGTTLKTFDLRSKAVIDSDFYYIQANDVIYVPQSKKKFLGSTSSFVSLFSILTSIAGVIVFIFRII